MCDSECIIVRNIYPTYLFYPRRKYGSSKIWQYKFQQGESQQICVRI